MPVIPLQLPQEVKYPTMDFSTLGSLGKVYDDARKKAGQEEVLKNASTDNSPQSLAKLGTDLLRAGDLQGAMTLANLARGMSQDEWNRTYQGSMLKISQQNADSTRLTATKDQPSVVDIGTPDGRKQKAIVNPSTGALQPIGSPIGDEVKLTPTDKKAVFEAEDDNAKLQSTVDAIKRAKELNSKIYTGLGASTLGSVGTSGLPGVGAILDKDRAAATTEWDQIMGGEAIKNMSATLKGASTDFEMKKFIGIMADTSKPPQVREAAMNRVLKLAERQQQINTARMNQLRGGQYFKKDGGQSAATPPSINAPAAQGGALQNGQRARNPQTGQIIEFRDGNWVPVQ